MADNVVSFPRKKPVQIEEILAMLDEDKKNIKTLFAIGVDHENRLFIMHTPFTDEDMVFIAKVLDVYANQCVESLIDQTLGVEG